MKRIFKIALLLLPVLPLGTLAAQEENPVVMNIAGKDITRSQFEYFFNKNNNSQNKTGKDVENYVDLFINYKLKVKAAEDARLDTLSSFIKEFRSYRDTQLLPYLSDAAFEDSLALSVYNTYKKEVGDSDLLHIAHIMMVLPQKADEQLKEKKKLRIDSAYQALRQGADFTELAKKCSEDYTTAPQGGDLPWIGPKQTLSEFEKEAYALKPGTYSKPFLSSVGYHIIYMKERKKLEPYAEKKAEILQMLDKRGLKEMASEHKVKEMVRKSNGKLTREDVMENLIEEGEKTNPNLKYLIEEYHDGLLLYEASNRIVWQKAAADEKGLEKYFKKNKAKYKWDSPRFKGFVIHTKSEKLLKDAGDFLKKYDEASAIEQYYKTLPKDSLKSIRVRFGIFKEGDDSSVDYAKFGKAKVAGANRFFPYFDVVGNVLKNPKSYKDVRAQETSDYQDEQEKLWVDGLRKKYPFSVNKDVLQTVNNHSKQ